MRLQLRVLAVLAVCSAATLIAVPGLRAQDWEHVQIETVDLGGGVYMLTGNGGNIGVAAGEDGVFLVDDQYAPLTDKIVAAVQAISDRPIGFVLNTHWHTDHTSGNENLRNAGALIVAHDNVRTRLSAPQYSEFFDRTVPPASTAALPSLTFSEAVTFHLNGGEIHAFHVEHAHTDGDAIVVFKNANVVHMGDTYFNGLYPYIDVSTGGSIDGTIAAVEKALALSDDETKVIPGHGPLADRAELLGYLEMLRGVRAAVAEAIAMGKDREAVIAARPTAKWDEEWGRVWLTPEQFTSIIYSDLSRER
jgi:glyoxylase-like metal-dependent hydrolase (beta-lactamase superfamily II)